MYLIQERPEGEPFGGWEERGFLKLDNHFVGSTQAVFGFSLEEEKSYDLQWWLLLCSGLSVENAQNTALSEYIAFPLAV